MWVDWRSQLPVAQPTPGTPRSPHQKPTSHARSDSRTPYRRPTMGVVGTPRVELSMPPTPRPPDSTANSPSRADAKMYNPSRAFDQRSPGHPRPLKRPSEDCRPGVTKPCTTPVVCELTDTTPPRSSTTKGSGVDIGKAPHRREETTSCIQSCSPDPASKATTRTVVKAPCTTPQPRPESRRLPSAGLTPARP